MGLSEKVKKILSYYEADNIGTKTNLARLLSHGALGGTGRLLILSVDQGFEHGPARSYLLNPLGFHPHYHFQLAVEASLSAYVGPLGWLEAGAETFIGQIPTVLKVNSNNLLRSNDLAPGHAITASVQDALRLGCCAIGFTIYPGSDESHKMFQDLKEIATEAKASGLVVIVWSYPRGKNISKKGETALDIVSYGAHMAALLGAHIIKVKIPLDYLEQTDSKILYESVSKESLKNRLQHVVKCCFEGRRLVIFSGGEKKNTHQLKEEALAIHQAGGTGSIIGRNAFQHPQEEALAFLKDIINIYQS